jgi:monoamine oxidase
MGRLAVDVCVVGAGYAGLPAARRSFGPVAVDALDAGERRRQVIAAMVERFGPRASSPSAFIETSWWKEPWTRGCSMAHGSPAS